MGNLIQSLFQEEHDNILQQLTLSYDLKEAVESIGNCRTSEMGGRVLYCPDMHGAMFLFSSCKRRGCPVCMESEELKWFSKKKQVVLPVKHNHLIAKLPHELSILWLHNKKLIQTIMFDALKSTMYRTNNQDSLKRGWLSVLHTAGKALSYHPHIHSLVTNGGLNDQGEWSEKELDIVFLQKSYSKNVRKKLLKSLNGYHLRIPGGTDQETITDIIRSIDFPIHRAGIYSEPDGVLKYLSRNLKSGVVSEKEMISYDNEFVSFYSKDKNSVYRLKRLEFIRRYLDHIPVNNFHVIRAYGLYSTQNMEKTKALKADLFGETVIEEQYEPEPFKCPVCQKELTVSKKYATEEIIQYLEEFKKLNPNIPTELGLASSFWTIKLSFSPAST